MKFNFFKKEEKTVPTHLSFNRDTNWEFDPTYNLSNPVIDTKRTFNYVPFGIDNFYPNILLNMFNGSPFHRALIDFKLKSTLGEGFDFESTKSSPIEEAKISKKINRRFITRLVKELLIHSRAYIKVTVLDNFKEIEIVPAERVRKNEDGSLYYVSKLWGLRRNDYDIITPYSKYNKESVQLLEFSEDSPGFDIYAVPSYATAANWIWLDSEISFFQKQNIENSVNPSAIINFYHDIANKEEKRKFVEDLQRSFASAKNAGKIMVFFSNGKDLAPEIKIAEPNKLDKSFAEAQHNIIKNVAYAHSVNPVLMGVSTPGKLGASNEINDAYSIFKSVWLNTFQDDVEDYINDIINIISEEDFNFKFKRRHTLI